MILLRFLLVDQRRKSQSLSIESQSESESGEDRGVERTSGRLRYPSNLISSVVAFPFYSSGKCSIRGLHMFRLCYCRYDL